MPSRIHVVGPPFLWGQCVTCTRPVCQCYTVWTEGRGPKEARPSPSADTTNTPPRPTTDESAIASWQPDPGDSSIPRRSEIFPFISKEERAGQGQGHHDPTTEDINQTLRCRRRFPLAGPCRHCAAGNWARFMFPRQGRVLLQHYHLGFYITKDDIKS